MKPQLTLLILLIGLISGPVFAQQSEILSFSEEVSLVGLDQEVLYEKAKVFFIDKYNNPHCPLKMNKNTGSVTGGGSETFDFSNKLKSNQVVMDYKIKMTLRENGYSLNITDFAYHQASKKGKRNNKLMLSNKVNKDVPKKTKLLQSKLKQEATTIAQLIKDDIKRQMYKQSTSEEIVNNTSNTRW